MGAKQKGQSHYSSSNASERVGMAEKNPQLAYVGFQATAVQEHNVVQHRNSAGYLLSGHL